MEENESFQKRLGKARVFIALLFGVLVARLWYLQIAQGDKYRALSRRNSVRIINVPAPRGLILDRNDRLLAGNTSSYQLCILPATRKAKEKQALAHLVSRLLGVPYETLLDKLEGRDIPAYSPIILKSDLSPEEIQKVEENLLCTYSVFVRKVSTRFYPKGSLAAHVVGYVGEVSPGELQAKGGELLSAGQVIGKEGVEKSCQQYLTGQPGVEELQVDAAGRLVDVLARKPETAGANVVLTLDLDLQRVAEEVLLNRTGCAILMDPVSGEILALASSPGFNSEMMSSGMPQDELSALLNDPRHPFLNRAFMSRYPPGSIFKIVTLFAALESGLATPNTSFLCTGTYKVGNRTFRCWKPSGHGLVSLQRAVAESCDVFFYQLGLKVGIDQLIEAARKLGLEGKTDIDLPGEIPSIVPGPDWKKQQFHTPWYSGDTVNAAVGQGFINTTPLGMAVVTAAVANRGTIVTPRVVKEIQGASRMPVPPPLEVGEGRRVDTKSSTWNVIRAGMRAAVASPNGTARIADLSSVAVAGKTGSAQTQPGAPTHAWFVCFAPYDNPEVVCVVLVEQGGYGGEMAAPIARKILEAYFSSNRK